MPEIHKSPRVLKMIQDKNIELIDLKFVDPLGTWQHLTLYQDKLTKIASQTGFRLTGLVFEVGNPLTSQRNNET